MPMNSDLFIRIIMTAVTVVLYFITISMVYALINKFGTRQRVFEKRTVLVKKFFVLLLFSTLLLILAFIWGIEFRGVLIFASSFFALVGVALFASWSILSNLTAGVIIFFSFPYKIGDRIRIVGDDDLTEGIIRDMTLFHIQIENSNNHIVLYPNNLVIQKPIVNLSRTSLNGRSPSTASISD